MRNFTVRLKNGSEIVAITVNASDWIRAVNVVLESEGAPSSCFLNVYERMKEGDKLWSGGVASKYLADAYNAVNDHIHAWEAMGKKAPEHLLNGRHNLLASVPGRGVEA